MPPVYSGTALLEERMRSLLHHCLMAGAPLCGAATVDASPRASGGGFFIVPGGSSGAPADTYPGELTQRRDVLALAFHVDYWDDLGWRDRFGLPDAVERQRAYAKALRLSTVYTPQVVIDGQDDFVGSDVKSIGRALTGNRNGVAVALSVRDGAVFT